MVKMERRKICRNYKQLTSIARVASGAVLAIASLAIAAPDADTRAAVVAISDGTTSDDAARAVRDGVASGFARAAAYAGVKVLDASTASALLSGGDARERAAKLEAATAQAKHGRALQAQLEFEQAARELEGARDAMTASLAGQNDGAVVDVLLDLGQADLDLRRAGPAADSFRQARTFGAPESLPSSYSPRTTAAYRDAIAPLKARSNAGLEVLTSPAGAKISIDGRPAGISPYFASGLVDGAHIIRADLPGAVPATETVTLAGGKTAKVSLSLVAAPLGGTLRAGTPEDELRSAVAIGDALHVDLLLATGVSRGAEGPRVRTLLVDVKRRVLIAAADGAGDPTDKASLEKAGASAGERARDHLRNAAPLPDPAALRFEDVQPAH